jgi:hypothetical protein|tara:strand:+ start:225 stop:428 length:204 start_codon:yes stop_codon:yes gene_type:complete
MIKIKPADDYVLYEVTCDYCDKEYTLNLPVEGLLPEKDVESLESCAFCGNLIEDPVERHSHDDDSWD